MKMKMKVKLFTSVYPDSNEQRNEELQYCVEKNLAAGFDDIVFISNHRNEDNIAIYSKLLRLQGQGQSLDTKLSIIKRDFIPTFNQWFSVMNIYKTDKADADSNSIYILANSDIFFEPETLEAIRDFYKIYSNQNQNICLALSRWDYSPGKEPVLFERADSQDTWVFFGKPRIMIEAEFTQGVAGCDNRLAFELQSAGYEVLNPCKTIKTYHYHDSDSRRWVGKEAVPPPYTLVKPY